jgi:SCP-2 sterol transfer family protein
VSTLATSAVERIDAFFDQLVNRGHVPLPLLDHVSGTVEFNIEGTDRRWLTINRGDLVVSHDAVPTDCVLICDPDTFIRIISGEQNLVAAAIRGSVRVAGNLALGLSIQRAVSDGDG